MLVSRVRHTLLTLAAHHHVFPFPLAAGAACLSAPRAMSIQQLQGPAPLLIVQPRHRTDLEEAVKLLQARYADVQPDVITVGKRRLGKQGPAFFGAGVVTTIKQELDLLESKHEPSHTDTSSDTELDTPSQQPLGVPNSSEPLAPVFVNQMLDPMQERNLAAALGRPIIDRVGLILDIFAQRAHTREAKLQVELASLVHQKARLVRMSEQNSGPGSGARLQVVSARQRGRSGAGSLGGGGGSGDAEIQMQRYRILRRVKTIRQALKAVSDNREVQRRGRQTAGVPQVAVVGYTNVGKSSLVNRLCGSALRSEDQLFVTLDPVTRRVQLPSGEACVLSDTVGFISELPVLLVEAFKATLEEVAKADLILHVLDASSPNVKQQREAVLKVLLSLGLPTYKLQTRMIEVWNKCDLLSTGEASVTTESDGMDWLPAATFKGEDSAAEDGTAGNAPGGRSRRICLHSCLASASQVHQRRRFRLQRARYVPPAAAPSGAATHVPEGLPAAAASLQKPLVDDGDELLPLAGGADQGPVVQASAACAAGMQPAASGTGLTPPASEVEADSAQMPAGVVNTGIGEEEASAQILKKVMALVLDAHSTTVGPHAVSFRPVVVATSMAHGWGYDSLLQELENKLAGSGLLRGVGRSAQRN